MAAHWGAGGLNCGNSVGKPKWFNLSTAQTYATTDSSKDSALFAVECRILKIRNF